MTATRYHNQAYQGSIVSTKGYLPGFISTLGCFHKHWISPDEYHPGLFLQVGDEYHLMNPKRATLKKKCDIPKNTGCLIGRLKTHNLIV